MTKPGTRAHWQLAALAVLFYAPCLQVGPQLSPRWRQWPRDQVRRFSSRTRTVALRTARNTKTEDSYRRRTYLRCRNANLDNEHLDNMMVRASHRAALFLAARSVTDYTSVTRRSSSPPAPFMSTAPSRRGVGTLQYSAQSQGCRCGSLT